MLDIAFKIWFTGFLLWMGVVAYTLDNTSRSMKELLVVLGVGFLLSMFWPFLVCGLIYIWWEQRTWEKNLEKYHKTNGNDISDFGGRE